MPIWLEAALGAAITVATLVDIFTTIVVPGPSSGVLRIPARIGGASLAVARRTPRGMKRGGRRSNVFAPLIFLLTFAAWMLLLLLGFGLLFHAARTRFAPPLGLGDAFYVTGSSLLTLGVSEVDARGVARWLILAAGLSGFAVITATISFILQIQTALHQRESRVLTLGSLAGTPPSGVRLLEAAGALGDADLHAFFREWRDWSAAVLHSHLSTPVIIFFHSVDEESDWLRALEAVLDAATLVMALTNHEARGAATLMHRAGSRTAARLAALLGDRHDHVEPLERAAVEAVAARLAAAGFPPIAIDTAAVATFNRLRGDYAGRIAGLAERLGAERVPPLA